MNTTLSAVTLEPVNVSKAKLWTGRVLTGVPAFLLFVDGVMKQLDLAQVVEASAKIGFQRSTLPILGLIEILAVLCVCFRRTAALGAVVLTGYFGGAVATHVRLGDPLLTHTLMPVFFATLIWGGLALRNDRIRALSPAVR
jgi:hypothetical protein